jgi:hypothetical protein
MPFSIVLTSAAIRVSRDNTGLLEKMRLFSSIFSQGLNEFALVKIEVPDASRPGGEGHGRRGPQRSNKGRSREHISQRSTAEINRLPKKSAKVKREMESETAKVPSVSPQSSLTKA